jgi:3'(2'), 5'-bisphosphate nucleotidase
MDHLQLAIEASLIAGKEIMDVYQSKDFGVRLKSDDSPLTEADLRAHQTIVSHIKHLDIPILSEEGEHDEYATRSQWKELWIVDPLDGTKEFVKRSNEFTVNIALVREGKVQMGVVFAPAINTIYWGDKSGAFKAILKDDWLTQDLECILKKVNPIELNASLPSTFTAVASVSHFSEETQNYIDQLRLQEGDVDLVSKGSSLKMCLLAEGSAHIYPRLGPTMEWDTAAGQAVVEAAGGQLIDWETRQQMIYNREQLRNNWFLATAKGIDPFRYIK